MSSTFLGSFGFTEDPFASTNAADEPLIGQYFVVPPFFPAVVGDPRVPKSNVVFAPRGGGKTAQKIMIERFAGQDKSFLCVAYDSFPPEGIPANRQATAEYHLYNITRSVLLAVLLKIENDATAESKLQQVDKILLVTLSRELLGPLNSAKFKDALNSIKSLGDKALDAWNTYGGAITTLINAIAAKFDFGKLEAKSAEFKPASESIRFKFEALLQLAQKIGFKSTYILVDRVDELVFTARDAEAAFDFLKSLLIDLPLLETPGAAFKFFLWDQMKDHYQEAGGRPDRLLEYSLDWSVEDLETVLERRLQSYSGGNVNRLDNLLTGDSPYDVHKLVAYFAHGSPRDMVRICKKIVDEHTRAGRFPPKIEFKTVKAAIMAFSLERARELYGEQFREIKKIGDITFTISGLASDVFRISQQAARAKVQKWLSSGAVVKIGDVPNPGNRPQYLYGIVDPRLAVAVLSAASLEDAVEGFLLICPDCSRLRIAFEGDITCPDCQGNFKAEEAATLSQVLQPA